MKCMLLAVLLAAPTMTAAADLATTEDTRNACTTAAGKFASNDSDAAFEGLSKHWPLPKEEVQSLAYKTKTQLAMVVDRFGTAIASEHLDSDVVGKSLIKHLYLIKFEKHALRFSCLFYKPREAWVVNAVQWDDTIGSLFGS